jgi:hypothetical protein
MESEQMPRGSKDEKRPADVVGTAIMAISRAKLVSTSIGRGAHRPCNLLDNAVRNHVSFRKDEVLLPGRSARLCASAQF